jgi:hypothetical protein
MVRGRAVVTSRDPKRGIVDVVEVCRGPCGENRVLFVDDGVKKAVADIDSCGLYRVTYNQEYHYDQPDLEVWHRDIQVCHKITHAQNTYNLEDLRGRRADLARTYTGRPDTHMR